MDFHPMIVHFPIALLSIYAVMELIRVKKLVNNESWIYVKTSFVIIGVVGAFASLSSGDAAKDGFRVMHDVIDMHSFWASTATWIFGILAGAYAVQLINMWKIDKFVKNEYFEKFWMLITKLKDFVLSHFVAVLGAVLGLIAISITGALGGYLVHGGGVDPIVDFVYGLFF